MLTRAFNVVGLIVRIAEWKAWLLAFAARRSVAAMLGYLIAAIVALGGLALLLGAGYVALETVVGASIAMAAIGVFLLLIASVVWIVANRRGKARSAGDALTEDEVQRKATNDEEQLRSMLGMTDHDTGPGSRRPPPRIQSPLPFDAIKGFDSPKVAMAAGFALLGLLGPGRLFRTIRIATALASITALANRAINEHQEKQGSQRAP